MDVEPGTVEDAEAVADMWVALAREQTEYDSHVVPEANRGVVREEATRHAVTGQLLVARGDDGVAGFVTFSIDRGSYEMDVSHGVVENIYVDPSYRGEGIGGELLAAAERRLEEDGADAVVLEAMAANRDARRFYRRHGYDSYRVKLEKSLESDNHSKEDR